MQTSLFDVVKGYITSDVVQKASTLVGESHADTKKTLEVAAPAIVTALADRASTPSGAHSLMGLLGDPSMHTTLEGLVGGTGPGATETLVQTGKDLLERALGTRASTLTSATASATGVKRSAVASLLGLAAPFVFRALGREVQARHLDASGLANLLQEHKRTAAGFLPTGLRDLLGTGAEAAARPQQAAAGRAWWPLLLIIPALLIAGLLLRKRGEPTVEQRATPDRSFGAGLPQQQQELRVGSVGSEISEWLASDSADPSRRFVFSGLQFDTATSTLMPASAATLDDVAAVLKAYPDARVTVEGHTDTMGDPAGNKVLSQNRAEAVKNALIARGVAADRIATAGFGQDRPISSNDTDEGRAKNRRTEIVVSRH